MNSTLDKKHMIEKMFSEIIGAKEGQDLGAIRRSNWPAWDSIRHIDLMLALEKAFAVRFSANEIIEIKSLEDIANIISDIQTRTQSK